MEEFRKAMKILITSTLVALLVFQTGSVSRAEDESSKDYVIDTLIVVDDVFYDRWKSYLDPKKTAPEEISDKIIEYLSLVVHQANKRLETTRRHSSIRIKMQVVDTKLNQAVLEFVPANILTRRIRAKAALKVFRNWVLNKGLGASYDHLMLITGKPMESINPGKKQGTVTGSAHIGTVCNTSGSSISVVQDLGGFQGVHVVAHELAHSLGAIHDGEPGAEACKEDNRFLMSPNGQSVSDGDSDVIKRNPWYMSSCSAAAISKNIERVVKSQSNCLAKASRAIPEFTSTTALVAGQVYNAVEQCRMLYGPGSSLCLGKSFSSLEEICTTMYCASTGSGCLQHFAAEGTTCGDRKWCQMGLCVDSEEAPERGDCPFGDTALLRGDGFTCADFIARYPSACYNDEIREVCCGSCAEVYTGRDVCPYGDRLTGCTREYCEQVYPNGTLVAEVCCGACNYTEPRQCQDVSLIDGLTCQERVQAYGNRECYNGTVAFHCCESCSSERMDRPGCEYGDLIRGSYCQVNAKHNCSGCTKRLTSVCCLTCDPDCPREKDENSDGGIQLAVNVILTLILPFLSIFILS
ncbi:hypothetical protein RRG08_015358 [Elysia crispata]|uniref:Peptidase M12B domain-containing protein n=1 Tax=Elysia crispata TaxID=231223 RepID=A0AAE1A8P4_9GAST|nr:hypothetical protein RRG08_015358 [Elysia crispata]